MVQRLRRGNGFVKLQFVEIPGPMLTWRQSKNARISRGFRDFELLARRVRKVRLLFHALSIGGVWRRESIMNKKAK
jgi:hypothetical protein